MSTPEIGRLLNDWIKPIATSMASVMIISISGFVIVTVPDFRVNLKTLSRNMEEVKQDVKDMKAETKSYQEGMNKVIMEALIKQGELETRIDYIEKQTEINKNSKP